jgi:exopolyphosphatase/guanosine-5'-triphosphate,3'-diphosphate pyrophosphatase
MPRFAAVDIGTNSVKLTAGESSGGDLRVLFDRTRITRLGKGVDKTRRFADEAVDLTLSALSEFTGEAREAGVTTFRAGGTSAMRDAENGDDFRRRAGDLLGCEIEVISGDREAELSFKAAVSDSSLWAPGGGRLLAFDVGGGSTELIAGRPDHVEAMRSLDIGAVRLTERFLHTDPATPSEMNQAQAAVDEALAQYPQLSVNRVIGIGGTATTIAKIQGCDEAALQGLQISAQDIDRIFHDLSSKPVEERRKTPGLDPARADVIPAGLLIVRRILARFDASGFALSLRGVRYGLLLEMAARPPSPASGGA